MAGSTAWSSANVPGLAESCCEALGIPVFSKDVTGRITFANAAFRDLLGLKKDEILGKKISDLCPQTAKDAEATDSAVLRGRSIQREITKSVKGIDRTFVVKKEPIKDASGNIVGLYGVLLDVTDKAEAYRELRHLYSVIRVVRYVNQLIVREGNLENIFEKACEHYASIPKYVEVFIGIVEDKSEPSVYYCGTRNLRTLVQESLRSHRDCWFAESEEGAFVVSNRSIECLGDPLLAASPDLHWIASPITVSESASGVIAIGMSGDSPSQDDMALLNEIAGDLSMAINKIRLEREWLEAREALKRSEERYRTLVEKSRVGIANLDSSYRLAYINEAAAEILGVEREAALGLDFRKFLAGESNGPALEEFFEKIRQGGNPPPYELKIVRPDGTVRYVDFMAVEVDSPDGDKQFVAQGVDITEQKHLLKQITSLYHFGRDVLSLKDEREIAQLTVETAKDLLGLWDTAFYVVDEGRRRLRLLAFTEEIPPEFHEIDLDSPKGIIAATARLGKLVYVPDVSKDRRFIQARGDTKSEVCIPVGGEGHVLGLINSDMPKKDPLHEHTLKALEILASFVAVAMENARLFSKVRVSELEFRSVAETLDDAIVIVDQEGKIVFWNAAAERIFGHRQEDVVGRPFSQLPMLMTSDARVKSGFPSPLAGAFTPGKRLKLRCIRKNGEIFPCEATYKTWTVAGNRYVSAAIRDTTEQERSQEALRESHRKLRRTLESLARSMELAIELRDPYTAKHQSRVAKLSAAIARELGLPEDRIEGLKYAGLLHDIGKLSVPTQILSKPTELSEEEFALIRAHPKKGYDILKQVDFPWPVAEIVYQHHERLDGTGYPQGLTGDRILLEARILAVADVVDAMVSHRPYRPALGLDKALEEIASGKGRLYDPDVVDACIRLFREKGFSFEQNS